MFLFLVFRQAYTAMRTALQLLSHIQNFELVFTKKYFNILSDYYRWDHVIELVLSIMNLRS